MSHDPRSILLTGATGFLGHYLLSEILRNTRAHCRLLITPPMDRDCQRLTRLLRDLDIDFEQQLASGRISFLAGRLPDTLDATGLDGVDCVIHAAASTSFRRNGAGEPYRTNVDGTRALLNRAAEAGVKHFVFVSTAYVGGRRSGILPRALLDGPEAGANDYERSKWEAEAAVAAWRTPGRRVTICRPSILIGDWRSGRATTFGGVYLLARAVSLLAKAVDEDVTIDRAAMPLRIMGRPDTPLNVIPVCAAARRTLECALDVDNDFAVHHVVNPRPPTAAQIKAWLENYFRLGGGSFTDLNWPWPDATRFEEAFYAAGEPVRDYFVRDLRFEDAALSSSTTDSASVDEDHFMRCLSFAESAAWGRRASPRPANAHATSALDPMWYFEDFLVRRLPGSTVSRVAALTARVRFVIDGFMGSDFTCGFEGGRLAELRRGSGGRAADFGFRVERGAFEEIVSGRRSLQSAFFAGAADLFGDTLGALKMVPLIEAFVREFPVI